MEVTSGSGDDETDSLLDEHGENYDDGHDDEEESENYIENLTRFIALFILKTKEENKLK